jgi:uncharacterized DUF497 family protein
MLIEFDPIKDASNQIKHGLSLGMAVELDWESARRIISLRRANRREVKHYVENF